MSRPRHGAHSMGDRCYPDLEATGALAAHREAAAPLRLNAPGPLAQETAGSGTPCGANRKRIGTAELGNRDKHDPLAAVGRELAVSGPDSAGPLRQDPAKARRFLGCSRGAAAKSPQPQTGWRSE